MNMMKKNGGFTLVELIVVIAILAILAGVAVPAYSGYIAKANEAADVTQLDAIKTAAFFGANEQTPGITVTEIDVTANSNTVTVNDNISVDVSAYSGAFVPKSTKYASGATWTDGTWSGK